MELFRAYDVRGIYPDTLDEEVALKIGKAFGIFNPGKIIVGRDIRLSGQSLMNKLIQGLISVGAHVIDIGITTSPVVMFSTRFLKCDGGVMVTASHNPKEYNGFKFYRRNGIPIDYESGINKIQKLYDYGNFNARAYLQKGKIERKNAHNDYISFLLKNINFKKKPLLKIVVDAGNGSAGILTPIILRKAGLKVFELFCNPDGNYPNHEPDPAKAENLVALKKKVIEKEADLGFAYDGDGDRLGVVDKDGKSVTSGIIFSILIRNALESKPGSKVVYTTLDSKAINDIINGHGGIPVVTRVGHTYITLKMLEENASIAGEISGHYYFQETFGADDALFASLKIVEHLVNSNKKISDFIRDYPKYFSEVSNKLRFPIKESEKFKFIGHLKERFEKEGLKIELLDGVKVFFNGGWAMFRPSNTEPIISISYEAKTLNEFKKLEKFVNEIISLIPK